MDLSPNFKWNDLAIADYATFEGLLGQKIVAVDGMYWRQVRPLFFRPLMQFNEYAAGTIRRPRSAIFGATQYAVGPSARTNSFLNFLFFTHAEAYSIESLDQNRKRQIRLAAKQFVIRPMLDREEFKAQAYSVYLSFYERTGYEVGAKRQDRNYFSQWCDAVFRLPNVLVLGGYRNGELGGVSLSFLIEGTVYYATFFSNNESMALFLSDLMLHSIRTVAAADARVRRIFVGSYKWKAGLDRFYLLRGASCVQQAALLELNPVISTLLKIGAPSAHRKLLGNLTE